jgi:Acetylornithine deacetylase/Succinyl-diaminopimelate desuccinylase and related deacylases
MAPAHHVPADSEFVQTLLRNLKEVTGITGEPEAIGGGTYVHNIPGGVAFGCTFPGTETRMHGADEVIPLHQLMDSARVFAKVIIDLCGA